MPRKVQLGGGRGHRLGVSSRFLLLLLRIDCDTLPNMSVSVPFFIAGNVTRRFLFLLLQQSRILSEQPIFHCIYNMMREIVTIQHFRAMKVVTCPGLQQQCDSSRSGALRVELSRD